MYNIVYHQLYCILSHSQLYNTVYHQLIVYCHTASVARLCTILYIISYIVYCHTASVARLCIILYIISYIVYCTQSVVQYCISSVTVIVYCHTASVARLCTILYIISYIVYCHTASVARHIYLRPGAGVGQCRKYMEVSYYKDFVYCVDNIISDVCQ